ncbi:DUF3040 domain-containing protein [Pseudonocardia sp. D17]|uniref:DUF3040 domain-containing protein n=1 Tax=Pseudonocardia sp. D17 TaxID=882661 RepID=UPI002B3A2D38|nr:hypothetical protein PSD17_19210 [Pseudonocardia sp. D17]
MTPPDPETPLSAAERQRLDQLERQLVVQFPDLDDEFRGHRRRLPRWMRSPELAVGVLLALGLLAAAVVLGGVGLAAAELAAMCVTAGVVLGAPRLLAKHAADSPGTGTPTRPSA